MLEANKNYSRQLPTTHLEMALVPLCQTGQSKLLPFLTPTLLLINKEATLS